MQPETPLDGSNLTVAMVTDNFELRLNFVLGQLLPRDGWDRDTAMSLCVELENTLEE